MPELGPSPVCSMEVLYMLTVCKFRSEGYKCHPVRTLEGLYVYKSRN